MPKYAAMNAFWKTFSKAVGLEGVKGITKVTIVVEVYKPIRMYVEGYPDMPNDDSLAKVFEMYEWADLEQGQPTPEANPTSNL